jgi:hypothetical protein
LKKEYKVKREVEVADLIGNQSFIHYINLLSLKFQAYYSDIRQAHATSWQTPPAATILRSALLENSLALTMTGIWGSAPDPRTLK